MEHERGGEGEGRGRFGLFEGLGEGLGENKLGEGATFDIKDNCVGWQKATVHGKLNKEKKAEAKAHISAAGKKGDAVEIDKGLTKFDNAIKG